MDCIEDIYEEIGLGNRMASLVSQNICGKIQNESIELSETHASMPSLEKQSAGLSSSPLMIQGTEGMLLRFARCCNPIPGDSIAGQIRAGRGILIHRETCNKIADIRDNPEKCVHLTWDKDIDSEFTVNIQVIVETERGIIAMIATIVTAADANIEKIIVEERDAALSTIHLQLKIQNRGHLAHTMKRLRTLRAVTKITRDK